MNTTTTKTGEGNAPRIDWKTFDKIEEQKAKIKALRQDRDYWMENAMNDADKLEKAEAQRDELLAALKWIRKYPDVLTSGFGPDVDRLISKSEQH